MEKVDELIIKVYRLSQRQARLQKEYEDVTREIQRLNTTIAELEGKDETEKSKD